MRIWTNIKTLNKAFKKDADIHKRPMPKLPLITDLQNMNPEEVKIAIDSWEQEFSDAIMLNNKSFNNALVRIRVCAFIKRFKNPYDNFNHNEHYTWCPHEEWVQNTTISQFSEPA